MSDCRSAVTALKQGHDRPLARHAPVYLVTLNRFMEGEINSESCESVGDKVLIFPSARKLRLFDRVSYYIC